jgi:hypothetical protein
LVIPTETKGPPLVPVLQPGLKNPPFVSHHQSRLDLRDLYPLPTGTEGPLPTSVYVRLLQRKQEKNHPLVFGVFRAFPELLSGKCVGGWLMLPTNTMPSLLAGAGPTPLCTTVVAGANCTRQHANFHVPSKIVFVSCVKLT